MAISDGAITIRLDRAAKAALDALVASGLTQSQAVRTALVATAARCTRAGLAAEAATLAADPADRAEAERAAALMGSLRRAR